MKACPLCGINCKSKTYGEYNIYKCDTKEYRNESDSYFQIGNLCYLLQKLDKGVSVEGLKEIINKEF